MKKLLFLFIMPLTLFSIARGQSIEFSVQFTGGLFSFAGHSATEQTYLFFSDVASVEPSPGNPYGSRNTFSYGLGIQLQRATSGNLLLGAQLGYERLRSNVTITETVNPWSHNPDASGKSTLRFDFITLHPNIGYRFQIVSLDFDLTVGPDFAFYLNSQEQAELKPTGNSHTKISHDFKDPGTDIRLRGQAVLYYGHWGLSAGYSYGLNNYQSSYVDGNPEAYARFIRFGLSYRF